MVIMERKLLTAEELAHLDDIIPHDKGLIEAVVNQHGGGSAESPDTVLRKAIRGCLAQQFLDLVPDGKLRNEASGDAAAFADGWEWCLEHGIE